MAGLLDPKKPQLSANKPGLSSLRTEESGVRVATAADNAHRSEFTKGAVSSIDKFQSFAGRTARDIGRDTGFKGLQEFGQEVQDRNNAEAELNPLKIQSYEQVTDIDSALDFAGGLAGQAAASLGLAIPGVIAGATLGVPTGVAAGLVTTAPVLFGESSEDIEERTGKAPSVLETLPAAVANTALEFLPPVKALKGVLRTKAATKARPAGDIPELSGIAKEVSQGTKLGVAKEIGKEAGKSSLYEGATEAAQQLNNILAASLIDDTVDISLEGNASELLNNFLGGAIGGAGFGTMGGVAQAIAASPTNAKLEETPKSFGGGTKTQFDTQEDKLNAANREALRAEIEETRQAAAEGQIDSETSSQAIQEAEARIQETFKPVQAEFGKTTKPKPKRATKEQLEALVGETSIEDELTKEFAKLNKAERRESRTKEEEFKDREDRERLMELRNSVNDIYGLEEQGRLTKEEADLEINELREEFNQDNNSNDSYDPNDFDNTAVEQEGVGTEVVGNKSQRARPSRTPTPTKIKSSLEKRFEEAVKEDSEGKGDDYVSPLKIETHEDIVKTEILEKGITSNEEPAFFKEKADELQRSILKTIRSNDKTSPTFKAKASVKLHKERIKGDKEFLRAYSSITRPKVKETALSEQLQNTDDISKLREKGIVVRANKNFDKTTQIKLPKGDKALDPFQVTVEGMKTSVGSKSEDKGGIPSVERVGTAFFEGLTSLLSNEKNPLGVSEKEAKAFFNSLDDNLVIFRAAGGKKYTIGEFKKLKGNSATSAVDSKIIKTTKLLQEAKENLRLGKPRTGKTVSELTTTLSALKAKKKAAVEEEVSSAVSQNDFSGEAGGDSNTDTGKPDRDRNKKVDAADPLLDVSVKDRANINAHVSAVLKIQELRQKGVQEGTGNLREEARKIYKETTGKDAPISANPLQIIKHLQTKAAELTKFATRTPEEKENTATVVGKQKRNPNKPLTKREQKELEKRTKASKKLAKDAKEKQLQTELNSLNLQLTKLTKQTEINKILKDIDKVTKSLEELRDPVTSKATVNEKGKIVLNKTTKRIVKESVSTTVKETKGKAELRQKQQSLPLEGVKDTPESIGGNEPVKQSKVVQNRTDAKGREVVVTANSTTDEDGFTKTKYTSKRGKFTTTSGLTYTSKDFLDEYEVISDARDGLIKNATEIRIREKRTSTKNNVVSLDISVVDANGAHTSYSVTAKLKETPKAENLTVSKGVSKKYFTEVTEKQKVEIARIKETYKEKYRTVIAKLNPKLRVIAEEMFATGKVIRTYQRQTDNLIHMINKGIKVQEGDPESKAIKEAIDSSTSGKDLVDFLLARTTTPLQKLTLKVLKRTIGDLKVANGTNISDVNVAGYFRKEHTVKFAEDSVFVQPYRVDVVVHELVHAITINKLNSGKFKAQEKTLNDLFTLAKETYAKSGKRHPEIDYAFKNRDEFVAQAFSSAATQKFLVDIKVDKNSNLLDKFISVVNSILGTTTEKTSNALSEVIRVTGELNLPEIQVMEKEFQKQEIEDTGRFSVEEIEQRNAVEQAPTATTDNTPESTWTVEELSKQENLGKEPQQEQPKESVEKIEKAQGKKKEASTPPDGPITPEDLLAADSKEVNNKLLQQAQSWLKIVGLSKIKIKILSYKEAAEFIKDMEGGVAQHDKIVKGNTRGFVTKPSKDGVRGIFIHPMLKPATMVEVLAHEVGHIITDHILEAMSTKLGVEFNKALLRDFKRWVSKRKLSTNETVESFEGIKGANRQALLAISQTNEKSLSDGQIEYLDKQQEYMADNIATWLLNPNKAPKSAVERLFRLIAFHLKSFINVSNPGAAETVFLDNMYARAPKLDPEINPLDLFGDVNKQLKTTNKLNKATAKRMLIAFHNQVGKKAFKEFQKENHNWSFEQMVMELATLSDADAFGILTHAAYKHNLKYTMSPNQKRALNLAAQSAPVQRQLHKILAREGQEVLDSLEDTDTAIAYMYQLWAGGQLNLGNKTTGIFSSIQKFFRHILGIISEDEQAMNVLNDIRNTQSLVRGQVRPNDAIREYVQGSIAENFMKSHGPTIKKWSDKASKFSVADTQLRRMKIPAIRKIADLIHHIPGAVNKGSNYLRSKQARAGEFHYQMQKIRRGLSKEQRIELNKVLLNLTDFKDHKDPQIIKAVKDTQSLFKGLRAYMMRAGLEVPNLGSNYFPWVLDLQALETDPTGFLNLVGQEKFKEDHERVANLINHARIAAAVHAVKKNKEEAEALIAKIKETGKLPEKGPVANYIKASGGLLATKDVPSYLYNQAINANGNIDSVEEHTTQVPSMRFTNSRLLDFVRKSKHSTKADREAMTGYVNQNAEDVMTIYVDQAVKRAEYTRYFGAEGEVLNELIEKAKRQGATEEEVKVTLNYVNGTLGTLGKDTAKWLNEKLNVPLPENTNSPINRKLQKAMGAILVLQNIRLLALITFSSFIDPLGIAVRSGSVSVAWKAFKVAAIGIKGDTDRKTQTELAAMLGIIDLATSTEAIRMEYGGANLGTGHLSTINDKFFKLTQIERFTRFTRVMATVAAQEMIKKHTGKNQTKDSVRYMQELSLQEGDASFNEDGTIKILTMEERFEILEEIRKGNNSIENEEILAKDDRVRNAVQQFVDDSILRPNPAIRPIWGSDPHFMLIMHLKSFTYAFYEKVLKRAALEIDEDNLGSLFGIMLMIPVIAMADFLKDILRGKDNTAVRADWGLVDYVGHYAERAGLLGLGTFANDAVNDVKYGSLPGTSYAGETYDILTDIVSGKAEGADFLPGSTALRYGRGQQLLDLVTE